MEESDGNQLVAFALSSSLEKDVSVGATVVRLKVIVSQWRQEET